jgi:uncharacterized phage-associated protein
MAYRALEVANELLSLPGAAARLTQMQLQKLVYLANGWNWAINGDQLVADPVEAWDYGPVYRDLYDHTRFRGKEPLGRLITDADSEAARVFGFRDSNSRAYHASLTERERSVIEHVWKRYGPLSGTQLSAMTHQKGTPWFTTYTTRGRSAVIPQDVIQRHYDGLADRAQSNAA